MKLVSEFVLTKSELPIDWRRCILSYLKHCLSEANDGKYFTDYYAPAKEKPFCFSVIFDSPQFSSSKVDVKGKRLTLILSSADTKTGFILFSAIAAQKGKSFPLPLGNSMKLVQLRQGQDTQVHSGRILVKMTEPLCIRKHDETTNRDWYYSPRQDDFSKESVRVISAQLMSAGFSENMSLVNLIPVNTKTIIVKYYGINIECAIGDFILEADKAVLNYLLKAGIGSRKSSGFGVMRLLAEE